MRKLLNFACAAGLVALTAACATGPDEDAAAGTSLPAVDVSSPDPRVKFKDGERYLSDLSDSLEMPRDAICRELGRYDCFTEAFRIVLGGMEGPNLLVNQPLEVEALTAPIAYDRVALNVCTSRVAMDAETPDTAVLFKRAGKPGTTPRPAWLRTTADEIYSRLLRRSPTPQERSRLIDFYRDVQASGESKDAARDWTVLGCFSVATSLEALFF